LCCGCVADIEKGSYDERDVERVRENDEYLKCFVRSFGDNGDMNHVLEKLDTVLTFRKKISLNGESYRCTDIVLLLLLQFPGYQKLSE